MSDNFNLAEAEATNIDDDFQAAWQGDAEARSALMELLKNANKHAEEEVLRRFQSGDKKAASLISHTFYAYVESLAAAKLKQSSVVGQGRIRVGSRIVNAGGQAPSQQEVANCANDFLLDFLKNYSEVLTNVAIRKQVYVRFCKFLRNRSENNENVAPEPQFENIDVSSVSLESQPRSALANDPVASRAASNRRQAEGGGALHVRRSQSIDEMMEEINNGTAQNKVRQSAIVDVEPEPLLIDLSPRKSQSSNLPIIPKPGAAGGKKSTVASDRFDDIMPTLTDMPVASKTKSGGLPIIPKSNLSGSRPAVSPRGSEPRANGADNARPAASSRPSQSFGLPVIPKKGQSGSMPAVSPRGSEPRANGADNARPAASSRPSQSFGLPVIPKKGQSGSMPAVSPRSSARPTTAERAVSSARPTTSERAATARPATSERAATVRPTTSERAATVRPANVRNSAITREDMTALEYSRPSREPLGHKARQVMKALRTLATTDVSAYQVVVMHYFGRRGFIDLCQDLTYDSPVEVGERLLRGLIGLSDIMAGSDPAKKS